MISQIIKSNEHNKTLIEKLNKRDENIENLVEEVKILVKEIIKKDKI